MIFNIFPIVGTRYAYWKTNFLKLKSKSTWKDNDHGKKSLHQDDITSFKADIKKYVDELCQLQHEFEAKVDRKSLIYAHEIECLKVPLFYFWIKSGFGDFIDLSSDDVDRTTYNMFIKNPISFLRSRVNFLDDNNITFINASLKDELSRLFNNEIKNREKNSFWVAHYGNSRIYLKSYLQDDRNKVN